MNVAPALSTFPGRTLPIAVLSLAAGLAHPGIAGAALLPTAKPATVIVGNDGAHPVPVDLGGAPVTVEIDPSTPLSVHETSDDVPVQRSVTATPPPAFPSATVTLFTVPPGKRLVIDFLSGASPTVLGYCELSVMTTVGGVSAKHHLGVNPPDILYAAQAVRLYADANTNFTARIDCSQGNGAAHGEFSFSGHLVDMP